MVFTAAILGIVLSTAPAGAQPAQQPPPAQPVQAKGASPIVEELWAAARAGDLERVTKALDAGADVNARTRYGATALTFAADKGHLEVVKLLISRGADVNAQDSFYQMRALDMAMQNDHTAVVVLLLQRGSRGAGRVLVRAAQAGNATIAAAALGADSVTAAEVRGALAAAKRRDDAALVALLEKKLAAMPPDAAPAVVIDRAVLQSYAGTYRNEAAGQSITVSLSGDTLNVVPPGAGAPPLTLVPTSPDTFRVAEAEGLTARFEGRGGTIERLVVSQGGSPQVWTRVVAPPAGAAAPSAPSAPGPPAVSAGDLKAAPRGTARNWPAFRGENAAGNGDGQGAPVEWDLATGRNIRWKTPIPGISNASPVIWGNRVFVVTAVSGAGDKTFRTGLYGDVAPVNDLSEHTWKVYCLDKQSGKILWHRDAFTGMPKVKRHPKASQANATPATDGRRVVALFGSIGLLAAWDMEGKPLWTQDIGVLDSGWFFDPDYQWGHSSSPIIHGDRVIVQADRSKDSFIAAFEAATGKQVWRTARDEISTWGTPTIFRAGGREQIVTNGPKIRAYDTATGRLLWTLGPNSEVTVGTPVTGDGVIYVTGGYPPVRPLYAIKPSAAGEIALSKEKPASDAVAWSNTEGTYIPTPLYYDGLLYTCGNNGVVTVYDGATGERIYRARVGGGGAFAASPVAADGRLYFANEDGDVIVVKAGRSYQELAKNAMKEVIMATPAISDGLLVVRTLGHVYGIAE